MNTPATTLGLIAGNRSLPLLLAQQARRMGVKRLVAVAFEKETNPDLASLVDHITWIRVGQLNKMIRVFKDQHVTQCVMAGQIAPNNLFNLRPDLRAMGLLLRLKEKNAHTLFGAIAEELRKDGIQLIDALPWLRPLMPGPGYTLGPAPAPDQLEDVRFGFRIAKEIARLEIGQTVVVKQGTVLAVEGFEGTDACLARGGQLAGKHGGAVAVKVARHNHDMRFDIPCVGLQTVTTCAESGITTLALEAHSTLVLDADDIQARSKRHRVSVLATGGA